MTVISLQLLGLENAVCRSGTLFCVKNSGGEAEEKERKQQNKEKQQRLLLIPLTWPFFAQALKLMILNGWLTEILGSCFNEY